MSAMGGNLGLFGSIEQLNQGPMEALAKNTSIAGVGIDPEGYVSILRWDYLRSGAHSLCSDAGSTTTRRTTPSCLSKPGEPNLCLTLAHGCKHGVCSGVVATVRGCGRHGLFWQRLSTRLRPNKSMSTTWATAPRQCQRAVAGIGSGVPSDPNGINVQPSTKRGGCS
jgi:hypothetical protein